MVQLGCIDCGRSHPGSVAICSCGGALDRADPLPAVTPEDLSGSGPGIWRHASAFGMAAEDAVSLGEGATPLVHDPELGARFKLEYLNPTGSFKDRGASVTVARAKALGARRVVEDSSGNAGSACAAYAGRAGLACTIFSPQTITAAKRARIETFGAALEIVPGARSKVTDAAVEAAEQGGTYYANHTYPPWFLEGCESIAYELARGPDGPPEVVITPCAMGSVLLGLHRGFSRMVEGGVVAEIPRLVATQAAGFDPVADALGGDRGPGENTIADGLLIPDPPRLEQLVEAVRATRGTALSVGQPATRAAMSRLHRRGLLAEPSSAVTLAARDRLVEQGWLEEDADAVLILTGRWPAS